MARKVRGLTSKKDKDARVSEEIQRLNDILTNIHESKRNIAKELIRNIAFMSVTLDDLKELINLMGPVVNFENGAQKMLVENPAQKSYNTMIARFTNATKQLFDLLPRDLPDIIPVQQQAEDSKPRDKLSSFQDKYKK